MSNWIYERPQKYLPKIKKILGPPTFIANVEHGMAYWKENTNSLFAEHYLRDEDVKHCVPKPHHDFFYSSIKIYVPPSKLLDVLKISGSINYDGLKHLLTARCGSIEANIATLYLGYKVASGAYTINHVKKQGLYASHIRGEAMSYNEMKGQLRKMKARNSKKYHKQLRLARYPLAFSSCA